MTHQPGVYVPFRALFLVKFKFNISSYFIYICGFYLMPRNFILLCEQAYEITQVPSVLKLKYGLSACTRR